MFYVICRALANIIAKSFELLFFYKTERPIEEYDEEHVNTLVTREEWAKCAAPKKTLILKYVYSFLY
jgi:hypothetical protein